MTPTHDAYLENGTCRGLTVGESTIVYAEQFVNMQKICDGKIVAVISGILQDQDRVEPYGANII